MAETTVLPQFDDALQKVKDGGLGAITAASNKLEFFMGSLREGRTAELERALEEMSGLLRQSEEARDKAEERCKVRARECFCMHITRD